MSRKDPLLSDRAPFRRAVVLAAALILAALIPSAASNASPSLRADTKGALRPVFRKVQVDRREVKQYWTKRRMERARPLDVAFDIDDAQEWTRVPKDAGEPVSVPATVPTTAGRTDLRVEDSESRTGELFAAGSIPFTRTEITDTAVFPNVTHGKLFISTTDFDGECSATVVSSEGQDVVWTAGHCVHDGSGDFHSDFLFVPGYRNGTAPEGEWVYDGVVTTHEWASASDFRFDVGALTMAPNGGQEIEEVVGARGIQFNQSHLQSYRSFGHPAAPPFDGEKMFVCTSEFGVFAPPKGPGPRPMGIGCDMTQGSSGGGWVVGDEFVQSVNSFFINRPKFEDVMFGPQLGNVALEVYDAASAGFSGVLEDTRPPKITGVSDKPDPFTPNGDHRKDKTRIRFSTDEQAVLVLTIKSKSGKTVLKVTPGTQPAASFVVTWGGRHFETNNKVKAGTYTYKISAKDDAGNSSSKSGKTTVRR